MGILVEKGGNFELIENNGPYMLNVDVKEHLKVKNKFVWKKNQLNVYFKK